MKNFRMFIYVFFNLCFVSEILLKNYRNRQFSLTTLSRISLMNDNKIRNQIAVYCCSVPGLGLICLNVPGPLPTPHRNASLRRAELRSYGDGDGPHFTYLWKAASLSLMVTSSSAPELVYSRLSLGRWRAAYSSKSRTQVNFSQAIARMGKSMGRVEFYA